MNNYQLLHVNFRPVIIAGNPTQTQLTTNGFNIPEAYMAGYWSDIQFPVCLHLNNFPERMSHPQEAPGIDTDVLCAVMSTIHYFDIFRHPLHITELQEMIHHRVISRQELNRALDYLVDGSFLHEHEGYYLPHSNFENIARRNKGAENAGKYWKVAREKSLLISKFPFVRAVLISGSLSKGYMDEKSDIDYLIITKPGRLWVARTLLVLYKKLFLFNSHKYFCVNYFIDYNHLDLKDQNVFTATELLFARPLYNYSMFEQLLEKNTWTKSFYPSLLPGYSIPETSNGEQLKNFLEKMLSGTVGDFADTFGMKFSNFFWKIKFRKMEKARFERDMQSVKSTSKHHPNGFRDRIINEHNSRMSRFKTRLNDIHRPEPVVQL